MDAPVVFATIVIVEVPEFEAVTTVEFALIWEVSAEASEIPVLD